MLHERWFLGRRTSSFTLQWHLTNACQFHCRHCYDRADRGALGLTQALDVLTDLLRFCCRRRVTPCVSLSGGDPLLYPYFWELYQAIAAAGIRVALLANPIDEPTIRRLLAERRPDCYQVSLEGLREQNDAVRGPGHFDRTMRFLSDARRLGLATHVMLTLTRANLDDVVPLGELLLGRTERFTFSRLASVGQAVDLETPRRAEFIAFLKRYARAARANPVLSCKDNLFNILRRRHGRRLLGGCTGFGCGAAFNFVALLPDGEVHACRKFPSPIGNLLKNDLGAVYDSPAARAYRRGPTACQACRLRGACGGCPAVAYGRGFNPLVDRDPDCFLSQHTLVASRPLPQKSPPPARR